MATLKEIRTAMDAAQELEVRDPTQVLYFVDKAIKGHGIESIWQGNDKPSCSYVNMGDTYARTLIWDETREEFRIMSWGDWLEEQEEAGHVYN